MRHLNGLIHSAGVLLNAPVSAMDPTSMASVLRAKAGGALMLDWLHLHQKHDLIPAFFFVNSSLASLHPSPGQYVYAAANALCDGLVRRRRAKGKGIGWDQPELGQFVGGMAANRAGINDQLRWLGLPGIRIEIGLQCFTHALNQNPIQWLCAKFDWTQLRQQKACILAAIPPK